MSWSTKAPYKDIVLYCQDWKSRLDLKDKFDLTNIESWHCARWLLKLDTDFEVRKYAGAKARAFEFRSRRWTVEKVQDDSEA